MGLDDFVEATVPLSGMFAEMPPLQNLNANVSVPQLLAEMIVDGADTAQSTYNTPARPTKRSRLATGGFSTPGIASAAGANALVVGSATKAKRKISRQKSSKYASEAFARNMVFKALLPRFTLKMHLPFTGQLLSNSGVQSVHGDVSRTYCFPKEDFLRQMLYKAQVDHQPWTRGQAYSVKDAGGNTIYTTTPYSYLTTGDDQNAATNAPNNTFALASGNMLTQQNWNCGIICKSFVRTYTLLNTGTFPCTMLIYEYVKKDDKDTHASLKSPASLWEEDLRAMEPMNNTNFHYTTNAQIALPQGTVQHSITDPGQRPTKRCIELNSTWRLKNVTSYVIGPSQSVVHQVLVPGFYVSARELNKTVFGALINKTHAVMMIQQGALGYEGSATAAGKIGIGPSSVSMRIESEATFIGLPNNKSYTSYECQEDNYALTDQNYALTTALTTIPACSERKLEQHENADLATAQTDGTVI